MSNEIDITYHDKELLEEFAFKQEKALVSVGIEAEGNAKIEIENPPRRVDTGRLRNSITWATMRDASHSSPSEADRCPNADDDRSVLIGTRVEYAPIIHEGSEQRKLAPNRFLRNAVERNEEKYRQIIDKTLKE